MKTLFGAILASVTGLVLLTGTSSISSAHSNIDVIASNWQFTPSTIQLHVGQTTTLHLTSKEGVHGLQSDDLGIPQTTIVPGSFTTVDITPKKVGTYVIHCSIICGAGHPNMTLTVKVLP